MNPQKSHIRVSAAVLIVAIGAGCAWAWMSFHSHDPALANKDIPPERKSCDLVRSGLDELIVPATVVARMGLHTATASIATQPITLPSFQGVLAFDYDQLSRVHSRFAGEVVELGHSTDGTDPMLRVGDRVKRGDLLAVIWSTELGQKKSELVTALSKLKAEEMLRNQLKKLFDEGAGSGRNYRDAEKDVQTRLIEVANIERTLRTWRLTDQDLAQIRSEAARPNDQQHVVEDQGSWARVEIRAPLSGILLEKNIVIGDIVDINTDIFKIGQLSHLMVWAHVYEEDLPLLQALPRPIPWSITVPSRPNTTFPGTLDKIGAVIDPSQHTALVSGRVENESESLKVGQFVTVSVQLPPPQHELELPATAVVEDGWRSVVFLQPIRDESRFVRQSVDVARRLHDKVYVRAVDSGIVPGDQIVVHGALLLQNALEQLAPPALGDAVSAFADAKSHR